MSKLQAAYSGLLMGFLKNSVELKARRATYYTLFLERP